MSGHDCLCEHCARAWVLGKHPQQVLYFASAQLPQGHWWRVLVNGERIGPRQAIAAHVGPNGWVVYTRVDDAGETHACGACRPEPELGQWPCLERVFGEVTVEVVRR